MIPAYNLPAAVDQSNAAEYIRLMGIAVSNWTAADRASFAVITGRQVEAPKPYTPTLCSMRGLWGNGVRS